MVAAVWLLLWLLQAPGDFGLQFKVELTTNGSAVSEPLMTSINQASDALCKLLNTSCSDLMAQASFVVQGGVAAVQTSSIGNSSTTSCPYVSSPPPPPLLSPPPPSPPSPPPPAVMETFYAQWCLAGTSSNATCPSATSQLANTTAASMQAALAQQPGVLSATVMPVDCITRVSVCGCGWTGQSVGPCRGPSHHLLSPAPLAVGVKGVGELGNCGSSAALANAIYNACGIRLRKFPISLSTLVPALAAS